MTDDGSVVVRRQLGRELRSWRERAGRSLDDVATAQIASISKVQRIEHGRTSVRPGDVRGLCRLYGVARDTTEALYARAVERLTSPSPDDPAGTTRSRYRRRPGRDRRCRRR